MKYASVTDRLADLGGQKWEIHALARKLVSEGHDIVELTIGEPDVSTPSELIQIASNAMINGRTGYSNGSGEASLLAALSERYSTRLGRKINTDQFLCLPGTQTSLYTVLMGLTETGDEVLVGDPMYATYEGVIAAGGATVVPVPLKPENGFRITAADIEKRITSKSRAILLNTPHNPTGAILSKQDILDICLLAQKHDLWIVSDEVYEEMVYDGEVFTSPLSFPEFSDRVVAVSSISKSHAAPGFRSGWCVGSAEFKARLLPLAETMLFGNQPFIADMTAEAVSKPSAAAIDMTARFSRRADMVFDALNNVSGLQAHRPQAGMFMLLNVASTGLTGKEFALDLLENGGVAVMPGDSFGTALTDWVRLGLTTDDESLMKACQRIVDYVSNRNTNKGAA
ncbi:pyridoxal phosphate-dependent aminotransferase [Amylibacter sp. SFDW26]|uniref:pyridoxal phosphate-dependent aminotransferase n=1 Tax=Amylibacter sp. SFDW26 TaxID=2652722 RepID=UPI0012624539|nr:pyridoxal phosphate-dependent aminotransferase [Amylibacter sp. SFDW26]KAB7614267.1 pyridoxal phosphate-dependent aminotransferase [Amylibacter sp. SFDW26]